MAAGEAVKRTLSSFLAAPEAARGKRVYCTTCKNEVASRLCLEFQALRAAGKTKAWQSWRWFNDEFLRREHGIEIGQAALSQHVRNCIREKP